LHFDAADISIASLASAAQIDGPTSARHDGPQHMKRLERILAVLDPTMDAQPALAKAARLADGSGASLELFVCDFEPALADPRFFKSDRLRVLREEFLAGRRQMLDRHAVELRSRGLTVTTEVRWDTPVHRGIVARVRESAPDLVVKDTHYHSVIRRTLLTNTDWQLIRDCPAPLLLVKASEWRRPVRILAAIDPGHEDDEPAALDHAILEYGSALAARLDGELHVAHAFFPAELIASTSTMIAAPAIDGGTIAEFLDQERARVREMLYALAGRHGIALEHVHFKQGSAVEVLCDAAGELPADVVVLGAIACGRMREMLVGGTAERVLDRIACDVLVIKPPGPPGL
jgi:universal stress protein E